MARTTQESDAADLARFGYRQQLDRTLGGFSAFAAGFSYLSVPHWLIPTLPPGLRRGGAGVFLDVASRLRGSGAGGALLRRTGGARYPLAGGVYPWSQRLGDANLGWMAGWVYLACSVITLASTALALQGALPALSPWFQFVGRADTANDAARNAVLLALGLVCFTTLMNAVGLRLLCVNNAGVFLEMFGVLLLILLLAMAARRGPAVVFDGQGRGRGHALGLLGPMPGALLMASFVLYGFDTAGTLAEETDYLRRRALRRSCWQSPLSVYREASSCSSPSCRAGLA